MPTFAGTVDADGTAELNSNLFTAGRPDDGQYTITLRSSLFSQTPAVVVTADRKDGSARTRVATLSGTSKNGFSVTIRDGDNDRKNTAFSFVMTDADGSGRH